MKGRAREEQSEERGNKVFLQWVQSETEVMFGENCLARLSMQMLVYSMFNMLFTNIYVCTVYTNAPFAVSLYLYYNTLLHNY